MGPIQMHTEANLTSARKKVKCQCMTIILATLVDRPFPMIYANIQPHAILDFVRITFLNVFFHINA